VGSGEFRLSGDERLRKRKEFLAVYERGEKVPGRFFFAYFLRNDVSRNRLGLTVSRRMGGPVVRNRIKRRLREIFRRRRRAIRPYCDLVLNVRRSAVDASYQLLEEELVRTAGKWSEKWTAASHGSPCFPSDGING
jgi:ribonuclease P protein component